MNNVGSGDEEQACNEMSIAKRCHIGFLIFIDLIMAILKLKTIFAPVLGTNGHCYWESV